MFFSVHLCLCTFSQNTDFNKHAKVFLHIIMLVTIALFQLCKLERHRALIVSSSLNVHLVKITLERDKEGFACPVVVSHFI